MIGFSERGWTGPGGWQEDYDDAQSHVDTELRAVVNRGAFNIRRDWRRRWSGYAHLRHLPNAVTYDVGGTGGTYTAEIGPDKSRRQGPLGNIIEFGSVNNAPIRGGLPAALAEEPRFERAVADAAEDGAGG